MKFKTYSLGCKVNIYEVEAITSELKNHGYELVENDQEADVIIINTCTVTSTSDSKSKQLIRRIRRANKDAIIVAMGCFVQLNSESVKKDLDVNIIIGTNKRNQIIELIDDYLSSNKVIDRVKPSSEYTKYEELKMCGLSTHTRGFVKIQDGCENFCTYCAIPYARGPIKSRDPQNVIEEIRNLVENGVKEIVLSGINTGTYGQDLGNITLARLLDKILMEVKGVYRLRLSSIELMEITDELLDVYEKYPVSITRHLHIPLQAGSDNTLKRMNRKYNTKEYEEVINKIRQRFEGIALTTDCLAGFVGETEEDFLNALAFIEKINYAEMHIFPYSRRKGTKADEMEGHLDHRLINERAKKMQELAKKMAKNYRNGFNNTKQLVLVEQLKNGKWIGHTSNYLEVSFTQTGDYNNKIVLVEIIDTSSPVVEGKFVEEVDDYYEV
ncbi:MAG: tRNA (N(6)-L-threonylcarbamoyladenosine(37)-C(2))-methylthiotransferase MtaB [Bacilli bacterium]|nr:tRNA (N(6)-L-threonylcarbamoyladenosine(37)-C(2))-methylthiotransferase MtaB [Bacilli bacterium]